MEVKKENKNKRVYSKTAGMLLSVTPENYSIFVKDGLKDLYVTAKKKSSNKDSDNSIGKSDDSDVLPVV